MTNITVKRLDIDTIAGTGPNYGRLTIEVNGQEVGFKLDQAQIDQIAGIAGAMGAELVTGMFQKAAA